MPRPLFPTPAAVTFLAIATSVGPLPGQAPSELPLLDEVEEIRLARSAAPARIAAEADVWVLRSSGLERAAAGTNGWTCLVDRDDRARWRPSASTRRGPAPCFPPSGPSSRSGTANAATSRPWTP